MTKKLLERMETERMNEMNILTDIIAPPLLGGVIGYSTNWLAIKMLFKPYKEVKIAGIKVPFTPGVIPKERERIAEKIGETVGNHLLTSDALTEELLSEDIKVKIQKATSKWLASMEQEESLGHCLQRVLGDELDPILDGLKTHFYQQFKEELTSDTFRMTAEREIAILVAEKLHDVENVKDLIGEEMAEELSKVLYEKSSMIFEGLKSTLRQEQVSDRMKTMIMDVISSKFGALGAMFLDGDSLYQTILDKVDEFLDNEENQERLQAYMDDVLHNFLDKNIDDLIGEEQKETLAKGIAGQVVVSLQDESVVNRIVDLVDEYVEKVLNGPVVISEELKDTLTGQAVTLYSKTIKDHGASLTSAFNFKSMITKQINDFDIRELEEVILALASKELKAITWFGALLGFIMGIILIF